MIGAALALSLVLLLVAGTLMATAACGGSTDRGVTAPAGDDAHAGHEGNAYGDGDKHQGSGHKAEGSDAERRHAPGHGEAGHDEDGREGHDGHAQEKRTLHLESAQRDPLSLRIAPAEAGTATDSVQAPATVAR